MEKSESGDLGAAAGPQCILGQHLWWGQWAMPPETEDNFFKFDE